jgi:sigma-54 dependent transcriptional regulator, acetoin dehydrogenase operon transcriptional activator AcoR
MMENRDARRELFSGLGPYPFNAVIGRALRFCLRNPYESIIIVDKEGLVQFMDRPSERFFGLQPGDAQGVSIEELAPRSDFQIAMTTGIPVIGRIREVGGIKRLCSVYPLKKEGRVIGAIARVVFHSLEEIERINSEMDDLRKEIHYLKQKERNEYSSVYTFDNILGTSKLMRDTVTTAKRISMLNTDVLIVGESGTGKELFAHGIHGYLHADRPFVRINCPAIPFELAESQLFGYEKGAFTGAASSGKAGVFEMANNGIVFLDEISSLPLSLQAKLLRVLQEREIQRVGSGKAIKVNFRFIAATNVDLQNLVEEGKFRSDLYYRVARATLHIPPLRERKEDIVVYLQSLLETVNKSFKATIRGFSREATDILVGYDWPGNVRQLIHVLEQIAIEAWDVKEIGVEHLPKEICLPKSHPYERNADSSPLDKPQQSRGKEKDSITAALRQTKGNKRRAAMLLGMPRSTFYQKIRRYGIKGIASADDAPHYS